VKFLVPRVREADFQHAKACVDAQVGGQRIVDVLWRL
jgi:hypothetical protein